MFHRKYIFIHGGCFIVILVFRGGLPLPKTNASGTQKQKDARLDFWKEVPSSSGSKVNFLVSYLANG